MGGACLAETDPAWAAATGARGEGRVARAADGVELQGAGALQKDGWSKARAVRPPAPSLTSPGRVSCGSAHPVSSGVCSPGPQSAAANARGPKAAPSPGGLTPARCRWWKRAWVRGRSPSRGPAVPLSRPRAAGRWGLPPGGWPPLPLAPPTPRAFILAPSWGSFTGSRCW